MKKDVVTLLCILGLSLVSPTYTIVQSVKFNQQCSGYLVQAANANSIDLAKECLGKAIRYAEKNKLTSGYTSCLFKTEGDNIGYWYKNMKFCQEELESAADKSSLEKTNVLMKLRESIMDSDQLNIPYGISRYPYNFLFGLLNIISVCAFLISLTLLPIFAFEI